MPNEASRKVIPQAEQAALIHSAFDETGVKFHDRAAALADFKAGGHEVTFDETGAGKLTFDLLVMDEASQIQPVDALGAIARCRQIVVVGDERQLPPTRFFSKMTSNADEDCEDEEDEGTADVADVESVLGLCMARGLPQRMLLALPEPSPVFDRGI